MPDHTSHSKQYDDQLFSEVTEKASSSNIGYNFPQGDVVANSGKKLKPGEYDIYQPWSNFILHTKLPDQILEKLLEITDKVFADPNPNDLMGSRLAGQMAEEYILDEQVYNEQDLQNYFCSVANEYVKLSRFQCLPTVNRETLAREQYRIQISGFWVNKQLPGDYNPMHTHDTTLSSVAYIKLPNRLPSLKKQVIYGDLYNPDGAIVFVNNTGTDDRFAGGILQYQPELGDFFVFAAKQPHSVHPYRSDDPNAERRSIAMNFNIDQIRDGIACERPENKYPYDKTTNNPNAPENKTPMVDKIPGNVNTDMPMGGGGGPQRNPYE